MRARCAAAGDEPLRARRQAFFERAVARRRRSRAALHSYGFVTFGEVEAAETLRQLAKVPFLGKTMNIGDAYRRPRDARTAGMPFPYDMAQLHAAGMTLLPHTALYAAGRGPRVALAPPQQTPAAAPVMLSQPPPVLEMGGGTRAYVINGAHFFVQPGAQPPLGAAPVPAAGAAPQIAQIVAVPVPVPVPMLVGQQQQQLPLQPLIVGGAPAASPSSPPRTTTSPSVPTPTVAAEPHVIAAAAQIAGDGQTAR